MTNTVSQRCLVLYGKFVFLSFKVVTHVEHWVWKEGLGVILKIERQKRPDYISYHLMRLIRKFPVPEMLPRVLECLQFHFSECLTRISCTMKEKIFLKNVWLMQVFGVEKLGVAGFIIWSHDEHFVVILFVKVKHLGLIIFLYFNTIRLTSK